jgi:hypothetical protein
LLFLLWEVNDAAAEYDGDDDLADCDCETDDDDDADDGAGDREDGDDENNDVKDLWLSIVY